MTFTFNSQARSGAKRLDEFDQTTIKNEPMLFSADPMFAREHGGPITRDFLDRLELSTLDWLTCCIDTRVHMLMPGWWPCIPGWHHDDVPRSRSDGQPDYENPAYRAQHALALVGGDVAPTEFALGEITLPKVPLGELVYKTWDPLVEASDLTRVKAPDRQIIYFDCDTFHQGTQAVANGWRWFGRVTWNAGYESGRKRANEIRRQVNVYMTAPKEGW